MRAFRFPFLIASLALALLTLGSGRANAQILLNGSFESPPISGQQPGPGALWSSSGGVFLTNNNNGTVGTTPYGSQYVEIGSQSSIYQVINGFVAGDQYVLGADFSGLTGEPSTNFTMIVSGAAFDGTSISTSTAAATGISQIPFQSTVLLFTATSTGSATITLEDLNGILNDGNGVLVDNIALYANPAPEPATDAEILLGLVALAGFARFRRRVALA